MKLVFTVLAGFTAFSLLGCNGQNPADRQSDPIKKYNGLRSDVVPGHEGKTENDGVIMVCNTPFTLAITDSQGKTAGNSLHFLVNENKSYDMHIASTSSFTLSLANAPSGLRMKKTDDFDYSISWQPTANQGNLAQDLKFVLSMPNDKCVKGVVFETVSLNVNVSSLQPSVSVIGIDSGRKYGAADQISFEVDVVDPTLGAGQQPQPLQLRSTDKNPTGELILLNTDNVAQCGAPSPTGAPQAFKFACSIDIGKLIATNPNRDSGVAALEIFEKSAAGESSVHVTKTILISMPNSVGAKP